MAVRQLILAFAAFASAYAQSAIPESASVARASWANALRAFRARDYATAQREVEHASRAWPVQPAYIWGRAAIAAQVGDTVALRTALADYAAFGLGHDLSDTVFNRYRTLSWFKSLSDAHDANRAPLRRSIVRATLGDSTTWPEGMDVDPRTGTFYVASIRHRTVIARSRDGIERPLWPIEQPGFGAVFAVRVDTSRGLLWASLAGAKQMAGYQPADSIIAAILKVRLADGAILQRWDLPRANHVLGDVALGPAGDIYITDSAEPVLYVLRAETERIDTITSPLFRSLQGSAATPDGRALYVADYSHGLLRVELSTREVAPVRVPPGVTTVGCDGIGFYRNAIIAVQNGVAPARIMKFALSANGAAITSAEILDRNSEIADEPTIGTIVGDEFVYVANSQWEKYTDDGQRRPTVRLTAPILLSLRLPAP